MPDDAPPALTQINVVVGDMATSIEFYRLLGLEPDAVPAEWAAHHRRLGSGVPELELDSRAFATVWNEGWDAGRSGAVVTFEYVSRDDVDRVHAALIAAGHRSQQAPYDAFWGARFAVVVDPDGQAVGLTSAGDPAFRRPPPSPPFEVPPGGEAR